VVAPAARLGGARSAPVLAAAIAGRADVIVTYNLKDFPAAALAPFGIEAQHPDQFLRHQFDLSPDLVCAVIRDLRAGLRNPPHTGDEYLATLERQDLHALATALRTRIAAL